jgi:hypothetical protein
LNNNEARQQWQQQRKPTSRFYKQNPTHLGILGVIVETHVLISVLELVINFICLPARLPACLAKFGK